MTIGTWDNRIREHLSNHTQSSIIRSINILQMIDISMNLIYFIIFDILLLNGNELNISDQYSYKIVDVVFISSQFSMTCIIHLHMPIKNNNTSKCILQSNLVFNFFFLNCKIWDKCYFCTPEYGKIMTRCYARSLTLHVGKQQLTKPTKIERLISMGAFLEDTVRLYSRTDFIVTLVGYVVHPS